MSKERRVRVSWTNNEQIAAMLDVTTGACTICGAAARVPEDVVAVRQTAGKQTPIVVCVDCQPAYVEKFREMLDRLEGERE